MPTFALRDIPGDLWPRVTARARADGWPLRALVLRLLEEYAAGRVELGPPPPRPDNQRG